MILRTRATSIPPAHVPLPIIQSYGLSTEFQGILGNIDQEVFGKKKQGGGHTALSMPWPLDFPKFYTKSNKSRHLSGRTGQDFCSILEHIIITAGITGAILFPVLRLNFSISKIDGCSESVGCGSQERGQKLIILSWNLQANLSQW